MRLRLRFGCNVGSQSRCNKWLVIPKNYSFAAREGDCQCIIWDTFYARSLRYMRDLHPSEISAELSLKLREVARLWAFSDHRPRIEFEVERHWDQLIEAWAHSDLPLVVRKGGGLRGGMVTHPAGRAIVLADNSPAHWAFTRAFQGLTYSLDDVKVQMEGHKIPFAYATKRSDKAGMRYTGTLSAADSLNKRGWKLCHLKPVGLKSAMPIEQSKIDVLINHFQLLMKPSNHFLVPLTWAGFGEMPEVIDEIRRYGKISDNW